MASVTVQFHDGPRDGELQAFIDPPAIILIPARTERRAMMGQKRQVWTFNYVYEEGETYEGIAHYYYLGEFNKKNVTEAA